MGREVRRVPADWQHPKKSNDSYIPLHGSSFAKCLADWNAGQQKWNEGLREDWGKPGEWKPLTFAESEATWEESYGGKPEASDYMPDWPEEQRTHFQMYEDTTEGTPISPVMPDVESLAHWLADNNASAFGSMTATYEEWLAMCKQGWAPSGVHSPATGFISGVAAAVQN